MVTVISTALINNASLIEGIATLFKGSALSIARRRLLGIKYAILFAM